MHHDLSMVVTTTENRFFKLIFTSKCCEVRYMISWFVFSESISLHTNVNVTIHFTYSSECNSIIKITFNIHKKDREDH